jgi:predicted NAD/FAD-dependent oxidoreductase
MQPVWSVMLVLDESPDLPWDAAFVNQSPLSWVARDGAKPGRDGAQTWVLHGSSEWSGKNLERRAEVVCEELRDAFFEATGVARRAARFAKAHRWRYALAMNPLGVESLWDSRLKAGVAGDWCAEGSVEGAYLSGLSLAERILEHSA